ncbi:hypothetical protein U1Q18_018223 [Sarracenia purpurea var. burkii]
MAEVFGFSSSVRLEGGFSPPAPAWLVVGVATEPLPKQEGFSLIPVERKKKVSDGDLALLGEVAEITSSCQTTAATDGGSQATGVTATRLVVDTKTPVEILGF